MQTNPFTVPVRGTPHVHAAAEPAATPAADASAARVMVVDDNRDAAEGLALLLGLLGAESRVAHDGAAALAVLQQWLPQLLLLDIGMPGMDGYEVARRIRADRRYDALTLVALTGWGQEEDRRRARAAGFDDHLVKPAAPDLLQALLAAARARHARHDAHGVRTTG